MPLFQPGVLPLALLWLSIGLCAVLGAWLRVGLYQLGQLGGWPWLAVLAPLGGATALANWLGCFLFGLTVSILPAEAPYTHAVRLCILGGFLGALTTFSSYAFDLVESLQTGATLRFWGILLAQNLGGGALLWLGVRLGGWLQSRWF